MKEIKEYQPEINSKWENIYLKYKEL